MMLSNVCHVQRSVAGVSPTGWIACIGYRARLGRPGWRLPLHTSIAGLGGSYRGSCPPTAC